MDAVDLANGSVEIRPLGRDDLAWSAALHRAQLPHGFFAQLGARYLRTYHASFITSPHALGLVAVARGRPSGFLLATTDGAAHYRHVLRSSGLRLVLRGALALTTRPRLLLRFVVTRARRYARGAHRLRRQHSLAPPKHGRASEVVHVAVNPTCSGKGVGSALLIHAEAAVAGLGAVRMIAKTTDAGGFYVSAGWVQVASTTDLEGVRHDVFKRRLDRPLASNGDRQTLPVAASATGLA